MPRRRSTAADLIDDVVDTAVDNIFERASDLVGRFRDSQQPVFTEQQLRSRFKCAGCHKMIVRPQVEMAHLDNGFALCRPCFWLMWNAAKEKISAFSKKAVRSGAQSRQRPPEVGPMKPPTEPPYEVLGVDIHASDEQVKKAYRKLAMQWHPDRWEGASSEEKHRANLMFQKVAQAYGVMMKVRQPPTAG